MRRRTALLSLLVLPLLVVPPAGAASAAEYGDVAAVELRSPALAAPGGDVLEVYSRAGNGALQRQVRDAGGRWSGLQSLGGYLTSKPSAVSMREGRTDVFARGGSGQLVQRYAVDGRWSGWVHLGGSFVGAPSVVSWAPGRLDVFARGRDGALLHTWFALGRWLGWERLGGSIASAPAAVSMTAGRLDVFARGGDGQLVHLYYPGGGVWSPWQRMGGVLHSEPAAVTTGDGQLDVFLRGGDGRLRQKSYRRGTSGWSGYRTLDGAVSSGPGAVVTATGDTVLSARDTAGRAIARVRAAGGEVWSPWSALDPLRVFRGLGAWVDLYDYEINGGTLDMTSALDDLRARGVRTLYLQTSRFNLTYDVAAPAGRWVDAAHARGIAVVGWYLPGYGDMARDLRRTLAVADFVSAGGERFDAVGVDIEAHTGIGTSNEVSRTEMNTRAVQHLQQVRARTTVPLAAITPQPVATDEAGETWEGFPWRGVGASVDLVLPMAYWPRTCTGSCVRDYTLTNARDAAAWSGRPVHVAGRGYPSGTTPVSDADITAFVDGAVAARVLGGSVYDYASTRTRTSWWSTLARLNGL